MQVAATILTTKQIGIDTWRDISTTKVFDISASIKDILDWANSIEKGFTISTIKITEVVE
jgi:hypothetical protein